MVSIFKLTYLQIYLCYFSGRKTFTKNILVSKELNLDWGFSIKHSISKVKLSGQIDEKLINEAHFLIVTNNKVEILPLRNIV